MKSLAISNPNLQVELADAAVRAEVVDPSRSFIVSAPAGSGKTALLTLRCLNLLSGVSKPEEILCITFTRKAAGEMLERIVGALQKTSRELAESGLSASEFTLQRIPTDNSYTAQIEQAALAVLAQDSRYQWRLLDNPSRLNITTIDSFCARVAREQPIANRLYGNLPVESNASADVLYEEATKDCLTYLAQSQPLYFKRLLDHYNGDLAIINSLLVLCLKQRSNWMHIAAGLQSEEPSDDTSDRTGSASENLESALESWAYELCNSIEARTFLSNPNHLLTLETMREVHAFVDYETPFPAHSELSKMGSFREKLANFYQPLCAFFTKADHEARISYNKLCGIPTKDILIAKNADDSIGFFSHATTKAQVGEALKEFKQRLVDLAKSISSSAEDALDVAALSAFPKACDRLCNEDISSALLQLFRPLLAHLQIVFDRRGLVDFTEVASSAVNALAEGDLLAQKLDAQVQHILIDEFQDTSQQQYQLLLNLVNEWQIDDGRTVFLVGDAMQSCYRFRDADVGLFIRLATKPTAKDSSEPSQYNPLERIEPRVLSTNFRSTDEIISFNNEVFQQVFPIRNDVKTGSVSYDASTFTKQNSISTENSLTQNIQIYEFWAKKPNRHAVEGSQELTADTDTIGPDDAETAETSWLADTLYSLTSPRSRHEDDLNTDLPSIAVLSRDKKSLKDLARALQDRQIPYQAEDIDTIFDRAYIQDIYYLARALSQKHDRLAWLNCLRAPWCGINNHDLWLIANHDRHPAASNHCIYTNLQELTLCKGISADGLKRVRNFFAQYEHIDNGEFLTLDTKLRSLWLALGGPNCLFSLGEQADIALFFELLQKHQSALWVENWQHFEDCLKELKSQSSQQPAQIQLMTIHKSKGLQFDHVYVIGLGRTARSDGKALFEPMIREFDDKTSHYLLGIEPPARPSFAKPKHRSSLYDLIRLYRRRAALLERQRLLYVACTRAKSKLTLLTTRMFSSTKRLDAAKAAFEQNEEKNETDQAGFIPVVKRVLEKTNSAHIIDAATEAFDAQDISDQQNKQRIPPQWERSRALEDRPLARFKTIYSLPEAEKAAQAKTNRRAFTGEMEAKHRYRTDHAVIPSRAYNTNEAAEGILMHRLLRRLALDPNYRNTLEKTLGNQGDLITTWSVQLRQMGAQPDELENIVSRILKHLPKILSSRYQELLFNVNYPEDLTEHRLFNNGQLHIVDRAFVIAAASVRKYLRDTQLDQMINNQLSKLASSEKSVRVIIDYKTSSQGASSLENFLASQKHLYQSQLLRYYHAFQQAKHLHSVDAHILALYFPYSDVIQITNIK